MTVPFEQIGPGQVGRLAYQVIGQNGPIYNPSNIAYLQPGELSGTPVFDPHAALAGLAGLNLAASVGTLAISGVLLNEVRQMQQHLAQIDSRLEEMSITLSDIHHRVQRIDTRVSETHLREALRHCLSLSTTDAGIDLTRLTPLIDDIENVQETVEGGFLFNFGIRLSSDLREQLTLLLRLLFGIRRNIICAHNQLVSTEPDLWIQHRRLGDYFWPGTPVDIVQFAIAAGRTDTVFNNFSEVLGETVYSQFMFAGEEERTQFKQLAVAHYYNPQMSALHSMPTTSMGLQLGAVLDKMGLDYEHEEAFSVGIDLFHVWTREADASLLFRLKAELEGIRDGYAAAFYPEHADTEPLQFRLPIFSLTDQAA
jgi:hypothetical protein